MSTAIAVPKLHHFFPQSRCVAVDAQGAISGSPETVSDTVPLPVGSSSYRFLGRYRPWRVVDALLVRSDGTVAPNRFRESKGEDGYNQWPNEMYRLRENGRLEFKAPTAEPFTIRWFDPRKEFGIDSRWVGISLKDLMVQGAGYVDESLIPPHGQHVDPRFQGGYRCYLEMVTLPRSGIARINDTHDGFLYKGRMGFRGRDSFEYRVYNSLGQESDVACITVNNI